MPKQSSFLSREVVAALSSFLTLVNLGTAVFLRAAGFDFEGGEDDFFACSIVWGGQLCVYLP